MARDIDPWWLNATEDDKIVWLAKAKLEAKAKPFPYTKIAWLYRLLFGSYPTDRVKKLADRLVRDA